MSKRPHLKSAKDWFIHIFYGMCMGSADLVPGISGGTMALILGFYEELIFSLKSLGSMEIFSLFTFRFKRFFKAVSWDFLLALLLGMLLTFYMLSQMIQTALNRPDYRTLLYAMFLGMILASSWFLSKRLRVWKGGYIVMLVSAAIVTFFATNTRVEPVVNGPSFHVFVPQELLKGIQGVKIANYDRERELLLHVSSANLSLMLARGSVTEKTPVIMTSTGKKGRAFEFVKPKKGDWFYPWLIFSGAVAVSAMLLPGISGSYLLTIFGAYPLVIRSLADFLAEGNLDAFIVLGNLGFGIVIGGVLFSHVIAYLLEHYHDATIAALLGFMLGALKVVWPFVTYEYVLDPVDLNRPPLLHSLEPYLPSFYSSELLSAIVAVLLGFLLVTVLTRISLNKASQNPDS